MTTNTEGAANIWRITPEQYAELKQIELADNLNGTDNIGAFVLRVFGRPMTIEVRND